MATKILLKKSSTSGSSPVTADLDQGELAINLADRKVFTKDNGNAIVNLTGPYVDSSAPANPAEGDLWYDSTNNLLKAHNGSAFASAGYSSFAALEDTTITAVADGEIIKYNGTAYVNNTLAEADIQPASTTVTTVQAGDLNMGTNKILYSNVYADVASLPAAASYHGMFAHAHATGKGYFAHAGAWKVLLDESNSDTDVLSEGSTNLYYTDARAQAAITAGTGVGVASGVVSIGQAVATSDSVVFADITTNSVHHTGTITINPNSGGAANAGTVVVAGDLTVNGTTTTVNSNEVNIGDAIIKLNSDETGTPSADAGIEVERGTGTNKLFIWNESDTAWDFGSETVQNITLDGGSY